jgi:hypothetical protein
MTGRDSRVGPPSGTVPVVVPGDVVLARSAGLVVWVGAVTVYPEGFAFTLLTLADTRRARQPASWALDVAERGRMTWLEIGYPDGRRRAADLNANTPRRQPRGPYLTVLNASASDGSSDSRWWVTPLPPPGPVELAIHLSGRAQPTGVAYLDGAALADAAARAEVVWTGDR